MLDFLLNLAFFICLSYKTSNLIVEGGTFHANVFIFYLFLRNDVALYSNSSGSVNVIAGNHTNDDSSLLDPPNGVRDFITDCILNSHDCDQSES